MTVGALRLSRTLRLLINAPQSFLFQDFLFQNVTHSELPYSNNYIFQDFPYQKKIPLQYISKTPVLQDFIPPIFHAIKNFPFGFTAQIWLKKLQQFCLLLKLHRQGSAINRTTLFSSQRDYTLHHWF